MLAILSNFLVLGTARFFLFGSICSPSCVNIYPKNVTSFTQKAHLSKLSVILNSSHILNIISKYFRCCGKDFEMHKFSSTNLNRNLRYPNTYSSALARAALLTFVPNENLMSC